MGGSDAGSYGGGCAAGSGSGVGWAGLDVRRQGDPEFGVERGGGASSRGVLDGADAFRARAAWCLEHRCADLGHGSGWRVLVDVLAFSSRGVWRGPVADSDKELGVGVGDGSGLE